MPYNDLSFGIRIQQSALSSMEEEKQTVLYSWKMDETYIKIRGRQHYLYRAIDADDLTLDIWLRKKRDTQAAYAFLKRLNKQFEEPRVIVTEKGTIYWRCIQETIK